MVRREYIGSYLEFEPGESICCFYDKWACVRPFVVYYQSDAQTLFFPFRHHFLPCSYQCQMENMRTDCLDYYPTSKGKLRLNSTFSVSLKHRVVFFKKNLMVSLFL
jgi:hypothetical protein